MDRESMIQYILRYSDSSSLTREDLEELDDDDLYVEWETYLKYFR